MIKNIFKTIFNGVLVGFGTMVGISAFNKLKDPVERVKIKKKFNKIKDAITGETES